MKAFSLFLFRLVTGGYLVAWSGSKILDTESAIAFSDQLYMGYASTPPLQHGLAALGAVLGIFVMIGFLRAFSYGVQAVVLAMAVAALARITIVLPVDLASGIEAATALAPGLALLLLALGLIVWRKDDGLALDRFIDWRKSDLAKDAAQAATLSAPVVAEVAHAEPAHDSHAPVEAHAEETHGHEAHGHNEHAHEVHTPTETHVELAEHIKPSAHANGHDSHADDHGNAVAHGDAHAHDEHKEPHHAH